MEYFYQNLENSSNIRGYSGIIFEKDEFIDFLRNDIKNKLIDKEQIDMLLKKLDSLE